MVKNKLKPHHGGSDSHSVVRFDEHGCKMFECIWDGWFVDENRNQCFWPPSKGKNYILRVLSKEKPDDTWKIYPCVVISAGHATYKNGFDFVKQKCEQKYNTSSADDFEENKKFRRNHPVLSAKAESFEHVFSNSKGATKRKTVVKTTDRVKKLNPPPNDAGARTVRVGQPPISIRPLTTKSRIRSLSSVRKASAYLVGQSRSDSRSPIANRRSSSKSCSNSPSIVRTGSDRRGARSVSRSSISKRNLSGVAITGEGSKSTLPEASTHSVGRSRSDTPPISNRRSTSKSCSKSPSIVRTGSDRSRSRSDSRSPISNRRSTSKSCSKSPSIVRMGSDRSRSRSDSRSPISNRRSTSKSCSKSLSIVRTGCDRGRPRSVRSSTQQNSSIVAITTGSHINSDRRAPNRSVSRSRSRSNTSRSNCTVPQHSDFFERRVKELTMIAKQNHHRNSVNERRIARMEVSINKILVTVTDLRNAINSESQKVQGGVSQPTETCDIPKGFKDPDFPLSTLPQLITLKRNLENAQFRAFLLKRESYYCTSSGQSDSVNMTAYLKRFIALKLREDIHFKDAKGKTEDPIFVRDFNEIYKFLIDVMITGYAASKRQLKETEAHVALRTVWGRTKQMLREQGNNI